MPWSGPAKLYVCCLLCQQTTFFAYHTHSYVGQNPRSLLWEKPNTMRDAFLTTLPRPLRWNLTEAYTSRMTISDLKELIPSPLSVLYCSSLFDLFLNCFLGVTVGAPWVHYLGLRSAICLSWFGGMFSGWCFQIQSRIHPEKNLTPYDACSTSSGALTALSSSFLLHSSSKKHGMARTVAVLYIIYKISEEHIFARIHIDHCRASFPHGDHLSPPISLREKLQFYLINLFYGPINTETASLPQVREWGSVGGVFLGMIWASLFFKPLQERMAIYKFYYTLAKYNPLKGM